MKCLILTSAMTLMCTLVMAQEVQWASKVLDFSSQLSEYQYAATQVLGKPDVLPDYGDNPNAWLPNRPDRVSSIKVGFDQPMQVRQIAIGESFNPGALYQVFLYDQNDTEYLLNTFMPRPLSVEGRLLNIYLSQTEFAVSAVKIVIDGSKVAGYNGIDAIGISGTTIPIQATKDIAFRRNPGLDNEYLDLGATGDVSDNRPVFIKSLNTLFFTRGSSPQNVAGAEDPGDVWWVLFDESTGQFSQPQAIIGPINDLGYNYSCDLIQGGDQPVLLLGNISGSSEKISNNVAKVARQGTEWSLQEELRIKNARFASFDADYTLAENNSVMILSTLRYDTEGERDLYISLLEEDGRWSEPLNIGGNINTTLDEFSPFYSEEERALYFASNGYPGMGGFDIFRISRLDDTWDNWSTPENVGTDINSESDEQYFYFDDADDYAYFARMNEDSTYGIIRVERPVFLEKTPMVTVRGNVINRETSRPVNSVVSMLILPEQNTYSMTIADQTTGSYEIQVPSGNQFQVISEKEGYEPFETTLALENKNSEYVYDLDIDMGLAVLLPDKVIAETDETPETPVTPEIRRDAEEEISPDDEISEIAFAFDSDKILPESIPVVDLLAEFMNKNSGILVELAGFTDQIGNEKYNYRLSVRRAESVKKYLVEKGVDERRIKVLGFGEWMPIISGKDMDMNDLRMNRRVEYNFTR